MRWPRSSSRFFGQRLMGYRWNQPAYSLSYANRRRLEIARATGRRSRGCSCSTSPPPGMNPHETHEITELIGRLRDEGGYTILVIEHDMHVVEGISDRVVALDHGVKIAEGSFEQVATDPRVVEAYLGRGTRGEVSANGAARCCGWTRSTPTTARSTSCRACRSTSGQGELVCLLGGNASGKSTTLKTMLGHRPAAERPVRFAGEDVTDRPRATGSARAWRSCPRTAASSRR